MPPGNGGGKERKIKMNEGKYRAKMRFFHPNAKGTGCALSLELQPATGDGDGCIMASFANQLTVGNRQASIPTYPTFNWEGAVTVKLDFSDLCRILQVLRGECESIDEGKGLYHRSSKAGTKINIRHLIDPVQGYVFEVHRVANEGGAESRAMIMFTPWEALGVAESIAGSMSAICFGIPKSASFAQNVKKPGSAHEAA
jgi:hypothetical protein